MAHIETMFLLSKFKVKQHIKAALTMDEIDFTATESKVAYEEIKAYVKEKTGLQGQQSLHRANEMEIRDYREDKLLPVKIRNFQTSLMPPEKEAAVRAAMEHSVMIG